MEDATRNWTAPIVSRLFTVRESIFSDIYVFYYFKYYSLISNENCILLQKFNYWYFRDIYSNAKRKQKILDCQFLPYQTGFKNLYKALDMPKERVELKPGYQPWYFGWSNCNPETAEEFRKHYGRPYFLPPTAENHAVDWFFIGTAGLGAHMHVSMNEASCN